MLQLLANFEKLLNPLLRQQAPPSRLARRLIKRVSNLLSAKGGALVAWDKDHNLLFCTTSGLNSGTARQLRQAVQRPTSQPALKISKMPCAYFGKRKYSKTGFSDLDEFLKQHQKQYVFHLWPLRWMTGHGLFILNFSTNPRLNADFCQAASSFVSLLLGNIFMRQHAASRLEDYRRIFANSRDMIYLSTRDGKWVDVNPAGVEMLGYDSLRQLLAVPDSARAAYFNPEDRSSFMSVIEKDGFVKDYEVVFKRKDGDPFYVSITAQVREIDGRVMGYEGIIKDITARKNAEAIAERQHKLISEILEVVPVAIFMVDRDHRIQHWNRACEELTGVNRKDVLGTDLVWKVFQRPNGVSLADVVVDQNWKLMNHIYAKERLRPSSLSAEGWEAEVHFNDLGGRAKDLIFTASLVRDNQGKIIGAVEAIMDTSQIKELERKLADSEKLYRTLVESNREGIALHDGEAFVFANQSFLDMFGLNNAGQAHDFLDLVAPQSRRAYLEWLKNMSVLGGALPILNGQGLSGDGPPFDMEVVAAPAPYRGREGILFSVRNVTYRKRMEEQLIRSERLAATGKLAFDIAHEVNNPLGGILTYAHLMLEDMEEEEGNFGTVEKIIKLANRCKIIVRGLLDFAREDRPEMEPMSLNNVLADTIELVEGHIIMNNIRTDSSYDPDLPTFFGLRSKLEQVFLNLIINAAEAMEGQGELEVSTKYDSEQKAIKIIIRDTGPGISPEVAKKAFEPFFTTKERGHGTGLGLSISHGIINQHNGRIELESEPGAGAVFTIVLPSGTNMVNGR